MPSPTPRPRRSPRTPNSKYRSSRDTTSPISAFLDQADEKETYPLDDTFTPGVQGSHASESTPALPHSLSHILEHLLGLHLGRHMCKLWCPERVLDRKRRAHEREESSESESYSPSVQFSVYQRKKGGDGPMTPDSAALATGLSIPACTNRICFRDPKISRRSSEVLGSPVGVGS